MKKFKCLVLLMVFVLSAGIFLNGCGNDSEKSTSDVKSSEKKHIKIGASPDAIPLVNSGVKSLDAMGYEVEVVSFDDFFVPNVALDEGSIDANFYQHAVFMNKYNKQKNTNIIMVMPLYNYYHCLYSRKADSIENIPEGGQIGIANDASNIDNDLRLLKKIGLISLTDKEKDFYGIVDIVDNPKNLQFVQLDYVQRVASFDNLAGMIIGSSVAFTSGLNPMEDVLFKEVKNDYALGLCINGNTHKPDEQWVKDLVAAYASDDAYQFVQDYYKGAFTRADNAKKSADN